MSKRNSNVSNSDTKKTADNIAGVAENTPQPAPPPDKKPLYDGEKHFAYVGPTLPGGMLNCNKILCGTYREITDYYKEAIAKYPGVARLFVPISRLAISRIEAEQGGTLLSKYYGEVAAAIKPKGEDE